MILVLGFYASLAALAAWATAKDEDLRWVGLWLVAGFAISNALYFAGISPVHRTGPYSAIEIMIAVAASCALATHSRWLILIFIFNLISIAANFALALNSTPPEQQIFIWNVTTNACFAAECLVAAGVGTAHGYRTGRFHRRFSLRRVASAYGLVRRAP